MYDLRYFVSWSWRSSTLFFIVPCPCGIRSVSYLALKAFGKWFSRKYQQEESIDEGPARRGHRFCMEEGREIAGAEVWSAAVVISTS